MKTKITKPARSVRELAKLLGRGESTCRKWRRRADWPFGPPPWDAEKVRRWADRTMDPEHRDHADRIPVDDLAVRERLAATRLKVARADLAELQQKIQSGEVHNAAECQQRRAAQIVAVRASLLNLSRSLPAMLAGREPKDMAKIIEQRVYAILNDFAGNPTSR